MSINTLEDNINFIREKLNAGELLIVKRFFVGRNTLLDGAVIYISSLADKEHIDNYIVKPLMDNGDEHIGGRKHILEYLCKRYIPFSDCCTENDIYTVIDAINLGYTALLIDRVPQYMLFNTSGGEFRSIAEPPNESTVRGPREGFVENLDTNISILKRMIKINTLTIEKFKTGRRSSTELALIYMSDLADKDIVDDLREKIKAIDVDSASGTGMIEQYIEDSPYSPFPQAFGTERPDRVRAGIMEGRIAVILNGTPYALTVPAVFPEFFHAVEDYYQRTLVSSFTRIIRYLAVFIVITLPSLYLTLISYNVELIPVKLIIPIAESRQGIALPPFFEIILMEVIVEFLREGGLRLPPKIGQTLSIVGGIIIGDAAVNSKFVSPTTLLIVGISVVASFLIPNYDMAISIRFIRFPMLLLADALGFLGIASGYCLLLTHLFSLKSFGVSYLSIKSSDLKDLVIRAPLWKMNKRPQSIPGNDTYRQTDFRKDLKEDKDE